MRYKKLMTPPPLRHNIYHFRPDIAASHINSKRVIITLGRELLLFACSLFLGTGAWYRYSEVTARPRLDPSRRCDSKGECWYPLLAF